MLAPVRPCPSTAAECSLTDFGRDLAEALAPLGAWGTDARGGRR
ncbi:hypothetical protein ACIQU6_31905 [Streptomyces sp. NPDC090442]